MAIAAAVLVTGNARGQTPAPEPAVIEAQNRDSTSEAVHAERSARCRLESTARRIRRPGGKRPTSSVPPITPLPETAMVPDSATRRDDSGATPRRRHACRSIPS